MKYFTPDFLEFFKELAANNHKDWFDENRKRYTTVVKEPFKKLVGDLIEDVKNSYDPDLLIEPKDAIFRINRDIRFAKDKTPYKTRLSAVLSPKGRKDHNYAGIYFELGPEQIGIYGGAFGPDTKQLLALRLFLAKNMSRFEKLLKEKNFVSHYGAIKGETHKRAPKELKEEAIEYPILLNKQFYYHASLDPQIIATEQLYPTLMEYFTAGKEINKFLREPFE